MMKNKKESISEKWNSYNLNSWNSVKLLEDVKSLYSSILKDYSVEDLVDFLGEKLSNESYEANDQFIGMFLLKMHNKGYLPKDKIEKYISDFKFSYLVEDESKVSVVCKFSNLLKMYEMVKDYAKLLQNQNNVASEYNANKTLEMFYFHALENKDKFECIEILKDCYRYEIFNKNVHKDDKDKKIKFEIRDRVLNNSFFMAIDSLLKENQINNMVLINYDEKINSISLSYEFDIKDKKYAEILNDVLSKFTIEENYILEALVDSKIKKLQMQEDTESLSIDKNKRGKGIKF